MRALSGTGAFALGGTLLVLAFFAFESEGGSGNGVAGVFGAAGAALLLAGLALTALGIWRIFHLELPSRRRAEGRQMAERRTRRVMLL